MDLGKYQKSGGASVAESTAVAVTRIASGNRPSFRADGRDGVSSSLTALAQLFSDKRRLTRLVDAVA